MRTLLDAHRLTPGKAARCDIGWSPVERSEFLPVGVAWLGLSPATKSPQNGPILALEGPQRRDGTFQIQISVQLDGGLWGVSEEFHSLIGGDPRFRVLVPCWKVISLYCRLLVRPFHEATDDMIATEKQIAFISKLMTERAPVPKRFAGAIADMSTGQASKFITELLASPRMVSQSTNGSTTARVTEVGMYRTPDGKIFKVQATKDTSNLYAKALTPIGGERLTETDTVVGWEFTYAPGALRTLTPDMRLSLDDAKAFGIRYGVCCVCGRTLKDATSVANGIGPICAGNL